jgi:hypothetical protein
MFSKAIVFMLGIIIPRLIILNYGSGANGLLSSIGDIYTYIALIEAGVGVAATQALYKPLAENNQEEISGVLISTRAYFRRLVKWYALAVLFLSLLYPIFVKSEFSYPIVFGVIFVQGISHILTYYFSSTLVQLLTADGREYVSQMISLLVFILNSVTKIILLSLQVNLVVIQCGYLIVNIIQISIITLYVKKKYPWINWTAKSNDGAMAKKNRYMLNGVAWTVFSSTDTILLAVFCGLAITSIYSIYNLVYANLNAIVIIFYSSTYFLLGQTFHESKEKFVKMYTGIETLLTGLTFSLFSVAYVMILPFISLYTKGADIQYVDLYLPLLFSLVQVISNARLLSGHVVNIYNQPQLINKDSMIEVGINLVVSIILVWWIGLYGVLIGTIAALLYKMIRLIYVANRTLLNRSPWGTYKIYLVNFLLFIAVIIFNYFIKPDVASYGDFVLYGILYMAVILPIFALVNVMINPQILVVAKNLIKRKKENK